MDLQAVLKHQFFGIKKQLAFLEDFYVLINDGIPPNRAIDMMVAATKGLTREVAAHISQKIGEGSPLADGMQEWFAPSIVEIIRVGETGGALAQTMQSAIKALSQHSVAIGALVGAVSYPLMVLAMASYLMVYLNGAVFNQFRAIKPESDWPPAGQQFVEIATFVQSWWWAVILGVVLLIAYSNINSTSTLSALFFLLGLLASAQVISYPTIAESNSLTITSTAMSTVAIFLNVVSFIAQPLFGWLIHLSWDGTKVNNIPVYSASNFHLAMVLLPLAFIISLLIAFKVRETYCQHASAEKISAAEILPDDLELSVN